MVFFDFHIYHISALWLYKLNMIWVSGIYNQNDEWTSFVDYMTGLYATKLPEFNICHMKHTCFLLITNNQTLPYHRTTVRYQAYLDMHNNIIQI